jgi:hypothetical protein
MGYLYPHPRYAMSNQPWRIKPTEIIRAIKSVQQTGLHVRDVEIGRDGSIRVHVSELSTVADAPVEETSEALRKLL